MFTVGFIAVHRAPEVSDHFLSTGRLSVDAILTSSASESAFIFVITCPRWSFTMISLVPGSKATCLLSLPETTRPITWRSRGRRLIAFLQFGELALLTARDAVLIKGLLDRTP